MRRTLAPYSLLALLTGLNLFNYFDRFILASVAESVRVDFALNDADLGSLSSAFMLGYFLTCPIFGYLGDRGARKWMIAGGIFVWSLATVRCGYATTFGELMAYRVLVGFGEASYATLGPTLLCDAFTKERRNFALTVFYVAIPLGAAFGSIFGSWAGAHYGWRNAFLWAGGPGLLLSLALLPFAEPARTTENGTYVHPTIRDIAGLFRLPKYQLAVWGYVAYTFALGAYQYWGQVFLQRHHGMELAAAGRFFGMTMVVTGLLGTFLGGFIAGKAAKRTKAGYALLLGWSVLLAVPLCVVFTVAEPKFAALSAISVAMLLLFLSTGPINMAIFEAVPANLRASATAISIFLIHAFGDVWSPYLVGATADHFASLRSGMLLLPPALLVCSLLWLRLARISRTT